MNMTPEERHKAMNRRKRADRKAAHKQVVTAAKERDELNAKARHDETNMRYMDQLGITFDEMFETLPNGKLRLRKRTNFAPH